MVLPLIQNSLSSRHVPDTLARGINYRARAFLNGHELDMGSFPEGMFLRREVEITSLVNRGNGHDHRSGEDNSSRCFDEKKKPLDSGTAKDPSNRLAIIVYPPNNPGVIPLNGGQGGDHRYRAMGSLRKANRMLLCGRERCFTLFNAWPLNCVLLQYRI